MNLYLLTKFLNEKAYDELWKTIKTEVLFFTGSVGDIEHIYLDDMLNGVEHMNFFEGRATEYSKASTKGSWVEAFEFTR